MPTRDIVAIGTSAGGVSALMFLAKRLPQQFAASLVITIHIPNGFHSALDELLTGAGSLPAAFARDGDPLLPGRIFIAPPNRHLLVDGDKLSLGIGPRENNVRPAIDAMMRSAAVCCGPRCIGVILTGTLGDGASGLRTLSRYGGIAVVQDPRDAAYPEMPANALSRAMPHHVANLAEVPGLLEQLIQQPAGMATPVPHPLKAEVDIARGGGAGIAGMDRLGGRSVLTCPDCNGVMWEVEDESVRYRCHVGHAYDADVLNIAVEENVRRALTSALRALEDRVAIADTLTAQASEQGREQVAELWKDRKAGFEREVEVLRSAMMRIQELADAERKAAFARQTPLTQE